MSQYDRDKWNARYRRRDLSRPQVPAWLAEMGDLAPPEGRAIDVAGGWGAAALWLAGRGLNVTLVDISEVALDAAAREAARLKLPLQTQQIDLAAEPFPAGPWDLVHMANFLQRSLFPDVARSLAAGGVLVYSQPTTGNLARHEKPPREYLLNDGELPGLIEPLGLEILRYEEGWSSQGRPDGALGGARHEARLVARRPG